MIEQTVSRRIPRDESTEERRELWRKIELVAGRLPRRSEMPAESQAPHPRATVETG
jgi:hypothetical protein